MSVGSACPGRYASATTPLQNWFLLPTSTSYLRTKSSLPSPPIRNTDRPAGSVLTVAAVAHRERDLARRDQHARARVEREGTQCDAARRPCSGPASALRSSGRWRTPRCRSRRRRTPSCLRTRRSRRRGWRHRACGRWDGRESVPAPWRSGDCGIGERFLDEHRLAGQPGRRVALVDVELVLALDRHVDPRLGRMEVEMPRPEMHAVAGLDRGELRQHAVLEAEVLSDPGFTGLSPGALLPRVIRMTFLLSGVAANLVGVFAGVERYWAAVTRSPSVPSRLMRWTVRNSGLL